MNTLSGPEYTQALTTLNLTPEQAATWLGIGRSTAYRYMTTGCEGPVVVAIRMAVAVVTLDRYDIGIYESYGDSVEERIEPDGEWVAYADLTAAVGVGS